MTGRSRDESGSRRRFPFTDWLLSIFASTGEKETIAGDLEEYYLEVLSERGARAAAREYRSQALHSCLRLLLGSVRWKLSLLRNYLVIAARNMKKGRVYSLINISGLALGLACSFLIATWVMDEIGFDRYNSASDRIYRVNYLYGANEEPNVWTQVQLAEAMRDGLAPVTDAALVCPLRRKLPVRFGDKSFLEKRTMISDNGFFDVFDVGFLRGSPGAALTEPASVVLTRTAAAKYFGSEDPLGKTIEIGLAGTPYEITAVIEDCPRNSHLQYDLIINDDWKGYGWGSNSVLTYIKLAEGSSARTLEPLMPGFIENTFAGPIMEGFGLSVDQFMDDPDKRFRFAFQPLTSIHLNPGRSDNVSLQGDASHVYIFSIVSLLILLIAGVNFINLSTARAGKRAKEVGIRKVIGADRKMLIRQFLCESVMSSSLSFLLSLALVYLMLPRFGGLSGKAMAAGEVFSLSTVSALLAVSLLCGLLAGLYPAFYISSFTPADAVRSGAAGRSHRSRTRDVLVVFQYAVATLIFLSAFVIFDQSRFLVSSDPGFDKESVLVVHRARLIGDKLGSFIQELERIPGVMAVCNSSSMPGRHFNPNGHRLEGSPEIDERTIFTMYSDSRFPEVFGVRLSRGRFFSDEVETDKTSAVVINETAASMLGLEDPVGKRFVKDFGGAGEGEFVTIIGVLEDFNFSSLHHRIEPMIIRNLGDSPGYYLTLRLADVGDTDRGAGLDKAATVEKVRDVWKEFADESLFEYSFLDDDLNALYESEFQTGRIMSGFFVLSVLIACLGLFGLVSYSAEQRTKEIGIRKVLGASTGDILALLSRRIAVLVVIANVIALPLSYIIMERWLEGFAYRTRFHIWLPAVSVLVGLALALLTVSYRVLVAAMADPARNIRYE